MDAAGHLYIADTDNQRIRMVVKYENYKRFGSETNVTFGDEVIPGPGLDLCGGGGDRQSHAETPGLALLMLAAGKPAGDAGWVLVGRELGMLVSGLARSHRLPMSVTLVRFVPLFSGTARAAISRP